MIRVFKIIFMCIFLYGVINANHVANIQAIHAIADGPNVDIYLSGILLNSNVQYGSFSNYVPFFPGNYVVQVTMAGVSPLTSTIITKDITLVGGDYLTFAAIGAIDNQMEYPLDILQLTDVIDIPDERALLRTVFLSASPRSVDVMDNITPLWTAITYPNTGDPEYQTLSSNVPYLIEIHDNMGSDDALAGPTLVNLPKNTANTLFVIGIVDSESSPLTIVYHQDFLTGQISATPTITRTPTRSPTRTPTRSPTRTPSATRSFNTSASNTPSHTPTISLSAINTRSPFRSVFVDDDDGDFTKSRTPVLASPFISRSPFRTLAPPEPSAILDDSDSVDTNAPFPSPFVSRTPFRTIEVDDDDFTSLSPGSSGSTILSISMIGNIIITIFVFIF